MMPILAHLIGMLATIRTFFLMAFTRATARIRANETAQASINGLVVLVVGILLTIIGSVLGLKLLAAMFPTYAESVSDITTAFNTTDWGDQTANEISPIFAMVTGIVGLLGLFALVIGVVLVVKRRGAA